MKRLMTMDIWWSDWSQPSTVCILCLSALYYSNNMSRLYFMSILLEEAYNLDCVNWSKAGGKSTVIRRSTLSRMYRDFVKHYRLTEELIDDLLENIQHLLQPIKRRGCTHKDKVSRQNFLWIKSSIDVNPRYIVNSIVKRCAPLLDNRLLFHAILQEWASTAILFLSYWWSGALPPGMPGLASLSKI